jgi:hypothetical protein
MLLFPTTLLLPQPLDTTDSPTFTGLTLSGLTEGLVPIIGVSGVISEDSDFTFASNVLGVPTIKGGALSGGSLTLQSTSHATKGKILFGTSAYDEVNNRLGVGTSSPSVPIQVGASTGTGAGHTDILPAALSGYYAANTVTGYAIEITRSRGNIGTPTIVGINDKIFSFDSYYYNGGLVFGGRFGVKMAGSTSEAEYYVEAMNFHIDDTYGIVLGAGRDTKIYYDATNLIIDPNLVGTGKVYIGATGNDTINAGTYEVGGVAGASFSGAVTNITVVNGIVTAVS